MTRKPETESAEVVPTRAERAVMEIARLVFYVAAMTFLYQWAFAPAIAEILKMPATAIGSRIGAALGLALVAIFGSVQLFDCIGWVIQGVFECVACRRARGGRQE
ncbi:hypothetical protein QZM43_32300 [Burkholderia orbicola]|uniref:hypothetical protein n=1 Tax=Burkholderia cepacia complex TaxID=87882 RepID=UPI0019047546|nr:MULTISPECIES: hypothetical protein [Burkholderia cepacia complex]MBJ9594089.1 hypothetical protein [Burkholderia seminalis]MDN7472555.1 hypothetical protein [Burkholderia orbicola]MDN7507425.1 hypothetical protein [Burkholderia orbicola]